jgi:hypothetical protein
MKCNTAIASLILASASATALAGGSGDVLLQDANSSAIFNSDTGQVSWVVDGVQNLFDQSFYFRRSTDTREYRVDDSNLGLGGFFASDTNPFIDNRNDTFAALYTDGAGLEIETTFTLRGGTNGSNTSSISELISISNNSNQSMTISMFQFVDMDLGGDFGDDWAAVVEANVVQQWDDSNFVSETVATPVPTLFQVDNQLNLINALEDDAITNLDGTASAGPTDIAWAFQWDITIAAGQSFLISIEKNIVPAPGSVALLAFAGVVSTRRRR